MQAAVEGGADWLICCDTNGGTMPEKVAAIVGELAGQFQTPLGIHTHNDCELAVANSLAAVSAGCTQIQGTINGYGERVGNANLCTIAADLQLKMGRDCVPPSP